MNILHADNNHPLLVEQLKAHGHQNYVDVLSSKSQISAKISYYNGLVIRCRFSIDRAFLDHYKNLKFN